MCRTSLVLRLSFLLGFVLLMPLLAFPSVARWADELLYGDRPQDAAGDSIHGDEDLAVSPEREVVHAVLQTPLSESTPAAKKGVQDHGLDSITPPPLAPTPDFPHATGNEAGPAAVPLDLSFDQLAFSSQRSQDETGRTAASQRMDEVRQRLEDLGADYILVKATEGTSQYHCQCRMLVAAGSELTESFEASGNAPVAALEQVLRAVEAWRANQASRTP